jgi:Fe-S cluster assembly protein SufD
MNWQVLRPRRRNYEFTVTKDLGLVVVARRGSSEITVSLNRPGVKALILGLVQARETDSLELRLVTIHRTANTHSETMIHGLVGDNAQVKISGLIKINKLAQRVTDFLTERVLLLSDQAKAVAEPELEIEADDVRASHAATVASLSQDELFYLMSRGVALPAAQKLITDGFLNQVINRIDDAKIRQRVCLMFKK